MRQARLSRVAPIALAAAVVLANAPYPAQVSAQEANKTVADDAPTQVVFHIRRFSTAAPLKILHLALNGRDVPLDQPIPVEGHWMRNLSLTLQNITTKNIVEAGIILILPETGQGTSAKPLLSLPLSVGRYPPKAFIQKDGTDRALKHGTEPPAANFGPEAQIAFSLSPASDEFQEHAYQLAGAPLTRVEVTLAPVYFADETKWSGGVYYKSEPPPQVWRVVPSDEFFPLDPSAPK